MEEEWYDDDAGPLVRPYAITRGRIPASDATLDLSTQVMALRTTREPTGLTPEHRSILDLCRQPLSVAELAVYVKTPIAVIKVLCNDLIERGDVIVRSPSTQPMQAPDRELLQAVLDGLTKL